MRHFLIEITDEFGGTNSFPLKDWLRNNPGYIPSGMHASESTSRQLSNGLKKAGWIIRETSTNVIHIKLENSSLPFGNED